MDKRDIIDFFNKKAETWDKNMVRNNDVINMILENAGVKKGASVLDVACGTGVLIPDYMKIEVASVLGIDISPKMIEIAKEKFAVPNVNFVCADVGSYVFDRKYDCIVVYNAFPHFPEPERLIAKLSKILNDAGSLTVAHGMSRKQIDEHHHNAAENVSAWLMDEKDLKHLFEKYLNVNVCISNNSMYQVSGIKKDEKKSL